MSNNVVEQNHTSNPSENDGFAYNDLVKFAKEITDICFGILYRAGPYQKEGLYQTLLIHELTKRKYKTIRERVFNMTFTDSDGDEVFVGDNQSLRTDIELPELRGILELKSTNAATKEENIWQLKNYLYQRKDIQWGLLINFISKFGKNSYPHVQVDILYPMTESTIYGEQVDKYKFKHICWGKIEEFDLTLTERLFENTDISKMWTETLHSEMYPGQDQILYDYKNTYCIINEIFSEFEQENIEQENIEQENIEQENA